MCAIALIFAGCAREPPLHQRDPGTHSGPVSSHHDRGTGCSDEELRRQARSVLRGLATFYHDSLTGNPTASGVPYDPEQLSAAHRTLPFGTRLRVTRTDVVSAAVLCVTVNDRGPFGGKGRIIDVSRRAAERLGMVRKGVVPVRVDVL
jgi:rare lipoprotein A